MSMPGWLNDAHPLPNGDNGNGAYNQSADPMSFMQSSTTFDYNRPQQQDLPQHLQNGNVRNGSPAFHNPQYQTQPLIPSKRSRPREDSVVASPRQAPGGLPTTRSQTPQQGGYPSLQGSLNGVQQFQGSTPYQQFPNPSSTASQSPIMQNQMYNQQQGPQRVQTVSPALFSPPPQSFGQQGSPVSSEHGSRNNTPHNGGQSYMQGVQFGGNHSQPFTPPTGANHTAPILGQFPQGSSSVQQQHQMYEMRQQQLMRQLQIQNAARQQGSQLNPSMNAPNQMVNHQMAARAQQIQQQQAMMMKSGGSSDQLVRTIASFMQQRGLQFNPHPTVAGRPIGLLQLFSTVLRLGGSKKVTMQSQWPTVAQHLQIPPTQHMLASPELHGYWQHNLLGYEVYYMQQQRQRMVSEQMKMAAQNGDPATAQGPWSPMKQAISLSPDQQLQRSMHAQAPVQPEFSSTVKHMPGQIQDPAQGQPNGYLTPQQVNQGRQASQARSNLQTQANSTPQRRQGPQKSGAPRIKEETATSQERSVEPRRNDKEAPRQHEIGEVFEPTIIPHPEDRVAETHGGLQAYWFKTSGADRRGETSGGGKELVDELIAAKPRAPNMLELGLVDIRALILSLRSGLHAEVRLALDTFATISRDSEPLPLHKCEDLLEVLVEGAEEQLDYLAENASEVSDDILISSYDDTVRGCGTEAQALQEVFEYGTLEYDLDRAVDKLLCTTTILRNFSDSPQNEPGLADSSLVRFMTTAIRYLGTRNMLLRSNQNTLDFSTDIIILLSNLSQEIDLPSKDDALCILHFLLSFAPSPPPSNVQGPDLNFPSYDPLVHRYYPYAVESLAKLLARDDPNRTFYRSVFLADAASSPPYDILTRTFGLATAGIPRRDNPMFRNLVPFRVPMLAMGLLAAEIIGNLIPISEHKVPRFWLASKDGFASSLVEICFMYGNSVYLQPQQNSRGINEPDPRGYGMIIRRGIALLLKLAERAKDPEASSAWLPSSVLPKNDRLLHALSNGDLESNLLRQICIYAGMEL